MTMRYSSVGTETTKAGGGASAHGDLVMTGAKKQLIIQAASITPAVTTPCSTPQRKETTTHKNNYWVTDFGATAIEIGFAGPFTLPGNWDGGTLTAKFAWIANSANTNGVVWGIAALMVPSGGVIDAAYGTAEEVVDLAEGAVGEHMLSDATDPITIGGTLAAGNRLTFKFYRDPTSGSDTLATACGLEYIIVEYGIDAVSEA